VNTILGLPFIKAIGMIVDFIDNLCQAKHLLANPFPIDFRHAIESISAVGGHGSASHSAKYKEMHQALGLLKAYITSKEDGHPLHLIVLLSANQGIQATPPKKISFGSCWEPPIKSVDNTNDYHHQVLRDWVFVSLILDPDLVSFMNLRQQASCL
jgi:hypothetical protein